jgi:hypothetical protein
MREFPGNNLSSINGLVEGAARCETGADYLKTVFSWLTFAVF